MSIKQDTQVVQSFLKELPENLVIQHIKTVTAKTNQKNSKVTRVFRGIKPLSVSYAQVHNQLKEKLSQLGEDVIQDVKDEIETLLQTLTPKYSKGDQLLKVTGIEKITFAEDDTTSQQESEFQVENGTVYLVDIWATWCGPCQGPMDHNQKMLEKNGEWAGKVKIVGISVDDDTESVVKRVQDKKWKSVEHYRFLKGWDEENTLIQYLQLRGIPFVMLIDKFGKIDYLGHPSKGNLEARINELIAVEGEGNQAQEQQNADAQAQELLTKEEFKESKQQVENLQNVIIEANFEGIVEVTLQKVNYWKQDGSKQVHKRSKLTLSYDVDVKEEAKINAFLENHWNKIPENLRFVKESKIRDPLRQIKEIKAKFQEIFAAQGVEISYNPIEKTSVSWNPKEGSASVSKSEKFTLTAKNINLDSYKKAQEQVKEYLSVYEDEDSSEINGTIETITETLRASVTLGPGSQFQSIENYKKWGEEECVTIEHVPGQVLFLDYWAKWCGPCVREIKKNTQLLQKNSEKWGKAVRFVSLSLVLAEDAKEFMDNNQESLKYIDFYFPKEQRQPDTTLYGVQYIPHYVVVDKFGIVRKIASVENVEELVEELINEQAQDKSSNAGANAEISEEAVGKVLEILQQAETFQKFVEVDKAQVLEFNTVFQQVQVDGSVKYKKPTLHIFCRDNQLEVVNQVLASIFSFIPETNWEISKTVSKTISVQYPGTVCVVCQKDITNEVQQYYSPFKKEHVCVECAEFDDKEKKGLERYKYQDTLIFINGPLTDQSVLENIDDHKIGKNLKLKEGEEGSQRHPMMCNGCRGGSEGPRYIATNARPGKYRQGGYIDYCQACFLILKDKKSEKAQEIIKQDEADGMTEDSLLVRVLFSLGGYTEF